MLKILRQKAFYVMSVFCEGNLFGSKISEAKGYLGKFNRYYYGTLLWPLCVHIVAVATSHGIA